MYVVRSLSLCVLVRCTNAFVKLSVAVFFFLAHYLFSQRKDLRICIQVPEAVRVVVKGILKEVRGKCMGQEHIFIASYICITFRLSETIILK